jgi:chromate reductase, NAD(P)H dehydrogenase (quinone)
MKILGIGGTLRKGSFSKTLLLEAQKITLDGVVIKITEIGDFPLYNPDILIPEVVNKFKQDIREADAILFSTAEYNYSIPAVLKNAIDWASRPYGDNSFDDKPAAIMSESTGLISGSRAQYHLRQILVMLNVHVLSKPEMMVPKAQDKFDKDGNLTDEHTKEKIKEVVEALATWTERLKK